MKILLDIDGVLVLSTSWKPVELLTDGFSKFNEKSVKALQRIIKETKSDIILTSSHKIRYNNEQWKDIFSIRGIDANISVLEERLTRYDEILNWVNKNPDEKFIIIDDDKSLNDLPTKIKERLVLTSSLIGLNEEDANNVIKLN